MVWAARGGMEWSSSARPIDQKLSTQRCFDRADSTSLSTPPSQIEMPGDRCASETLTTRMFVLVAVVHLRERWLRVVGLQCDTLLRPWLLAVRLGLKTSYHVNGTIVCRGLCLLLVFGVRCGPCCVASQTALSFGKYMSEVFRQRLPLPLEQGMQMAGTSDLFSFRYKSHKCNSFDQALSSRSPQGVAYETCDVASGCLRQD